MKTFASTRRPFTAVLLVLVVTSASAQNNFYGIGASILSLVSDWIGVFLTAKGMQGTSGELLVPGAPVGWIWDNRDSLGYGAPNPQTYLQTNSVDVLFLCPSGDDKAEAAAVANFALAAIQGNPNVRVFIQERYNVEPDTNGLSRFCFFDGTCDPTETIDLLFRPDMLRTAHMAAQQIGRPVYDVPVASALEAVKELITAGELDNFHSRMDLHNGLQPDGSIDSHLNKYGQYIMAAAVWAAVYHQDPRTLPPVFTGWFIGGNDTMALSTHDATLINQAIYDVVKGRSFSGWYGSEPTSYAAYMDSMTAALMNYETFEKIDTVYGSGNDRKNGSFVGQNGITWTYHHGWGTAMSQLVINEETMLLAEQAAPGDPSYLSATIPNGISELTFQYRGRYTPPTTDGYKYKIVVIAGSDTLGILDKIDVGDTTYARRFEDVNLPPGGTLKFLQIGNDAARLDNISWKDYAGAVGNAKSVSARATLPSRATYHCGVLSIPTGTRGLLAVATLDGRTVARHELRGETEVRLALEAGLYVVTVSGARRSEGFRVLVR